MKYFYFILLLVFFNCSEKDYSDKRQDSNEEIIDHEEIEDNVVKFTAPTENSQGLIENLNNGCGYNYSFSSEQTYLSLPTQRESDQLNLILDHIGIPMSFEFYSANIENAVAVQIDNKRFIVYDKRLFNYTDRLGNTYWNSMSILAHEIGHHLSGHTLDSNSGLDAELEADKFSGFILFKMGASLEEAIGAMVLLGSDMASKSHPAKSDRINAIQSGWEEANAQRYTSAVPPTPIDDNDSWQEDEFDVYDLINPDYIEAYTTGQLYSKYEGIIINVDNEDPSGVSPSNFNKVVTIQLTKVLDEPYRSEGKRGSKAGDRYKFHLLDYYQMDRIGLSYLEALMVPGRKIYFESLYVGYGGEDFVYIKKLNR